MADLISKVKCKFCNKILIYDDKAVYCYGCQFWCHVKYEKSSDTEYSALTKQNLKQSGIVINVRKKVKKILQTNSPVWLQLYW